MSRVAVAILTLLLTVSCLHVAPKPDAAAAAGADETAARLTEVEALIQAGRLEAAQQKLTPLVGAGPHQERVAALLTDISTKLGEQRQAKATEEDLTGALRNQEGREALRESSRRLDEAERLMNEGQLPQAQETIAPLLGSKLFTDEVKTLSAEINRRRTQASIQEAQKLTEQRAMTDLERGLTLPGNYGRTVVISRDQTPMELPVGPMETLFSRKVEMHLQNAGVKELVMALSNIDGLNIIADEALEAEKQLTINVKDVPLQEVLSYIARNMGVAFHLGENTVWVTASEEPAGSGPKLETRIIKLSKGFIPAGSGGGGGGGGAGGGGGGGGGEDMELEDALESFLADSPEGASYRVFRNRNLLVVRNTRENLRIVEELVRTFDERPQQVIIEARFVTVSQTDLFELGLDFPEAGPTSWGVSMEGRDVDEKSPVMTMDAGSFLPAFTNAPNGGNMKLTGILGNYTYTATLHALAKKGSAKTLSAPRVTVVNNQSARIRKGDTLYYFKEYEVQTVDSGDNAGQTNVPVPSGEPEELELGITLDVKVNIGNDGQTVMLSLQPQVTQFVKWLNFDTADTGNSGGDSGDSSSPAGRISLPQTNENTLQTTVVVNSGETVVLGGMMVDSEQDEVSKVPWLGDIPWLGVLFRHTTREKKPEHLLIFVTAKIISPAGDFVRTEERPAPARQGP